MAGKGLVSIIMLSHGDDAQACETVKSVLSQTYHNWELLFVAESNDKALSMVLEMRAEDARLLRAVNINEPSCYQSESRIKVSYIYDQNKVTPRRNSALRDTRGKWIAFLDAGDIWKPTKLEEQIAFMEQNGYAFSYTKYSLIDKDSKDRGFLIGGKEKVTYQEMMKCCWPAYMTVMYDAEKIGKLTLKNLKSNNDYALWLKVSEKADCYLLDECLAKLRTPGGRLGKYLKTNKIKWRYEVYRIEKEMNPVVACLMTIRNMWYGMVKRVKYVKKVR